MRHVHSTVITMIVYLSVGLGCSTVIAPEAAALQAAQIIALSDHLVWSRLRAKYFNTWVSLKVADRKSRDDK